MIRSRGVATPPRLILITSLGRPGAISANALRFRLLVSKVQELTATTDTPARSARSASSGVRTSATAAMPSDSARSSSASKRAWSRMPTCSGMASAP